MATVTETSVKQVGVLDKGPCLLWVDTGRAPFSMTPVGPCVLGLLVFSKREWTRPSGGSLE